MALAISEFAAALKHTGARASLFEVTLTGLIMDDIPTASKVKTASIASDIKFVCRATTIPGMTITPITTQYFGREIKTPGEMEFADWSITVINDNNQRVRRFMESWSNLINSHSDNTFFDKATYSGVDRSSWPWTGNATIAQFNKTGGVSQKYKMNDAWPTSIDPIEMSYDNVGTIQEFGVTFAINHWEHLLNKGAGGEKNT